MPRPAPRWIAVLPFVPALAGLALAVWRFRDSDPIAGLAFGIGGMILMVFVAIRLPDSGRR